jgi:hypothetical protein
LSAGEVGLEVILDVAFILKALANSDDCDQTYDEDGFNDDDDVWAED